MALTIATFSNQTGGNAFYKAVTHPLAAAKASELLAALKKARRVALYDPFGDLVDFVAFFPLDGVEIAGLYVQNTDKIGKASFGSIAQPITMLKEGTYDALLIAAFDQGKALSQIAHLVTPKTAIFSFDALRLPDEMVTNKRSYLSTINFATNWAFFREGHGHHTRIVTANYWGAYGAQNASLFCCLLGENGKQLAAWHDPLPAANASIVIDSALVAKRFSLSAFTGQLFMHVVGAAGHDVVKYALDTYGDDEAVLSCTHDSNAWPSDLYAGLPAPATGEHVYLWLQNSHPRAIAANEVALSVMGDQAKAFFDQEIAAYASYRLDVSSLLPKLAFPQQIEIHAGKHLVRPRYEIIAQNGHARISHPNVERDDLKTDPRLPALADYLGKLHIVPAPILPMDQFTSLALPTPMSTAQTQLPIKAMIYDAGGQLVMTHKFGNLPRDHQELLNINQLLGGRNLPSGYGHVEIVYDFAAGQEADGWLHALFRYEDRQSGHSAETSFGAHIFNTVLTYKNEPQSYAGKAPGLTTRLFLRCGPEPYDTLCCLIYPASLPWHKASETALILTSEEGQEIARRDVRIACSGSLLWRVRAMFSEKELAAAGTHSYVIIRDATCRLFGYHGLVSGDKAFSLDHMFGF